MNVYNDLEKHEGNKIPVSVHGARRWPDPSNLQSGLSLLLLDAYGLHALPFLFLLLLLNLGVAHLPLFQQLLKTRLAFAFDGESTLLRRRFLRRLLLLPLLPLFFPLDQSTLLNLEMKMNE